MAATECQPGVPLVQHVDGADAIVVAEVISEDQSVQEATHLPNGDVILRVPALGIPYLIDVKRTYKSAVPGRHLHVYSLMVIGAPDRQVGDRWLLFLHRDGDGRMQIGPCTPSVRLEAGEPLPADLQAVLGEGKVFGLDWRAAGVGIVAGVLVMAFLLWFRGRSGRRNA